MALEVAREIDDPDACVVTMLCDTGERYLSKLYNDEWLREHQLLEPARVTAALMMSLKSHDVPETIVSVEPATPVRRALEFMTSRNISQLPVIAEGDCVGHVTDATLMARVVENPSVLDLPVQELMDPPLPVIDEHVPLEAVTRLLTRQNPAVLVRHEGALAGIITRFDVLSYLTGKG